MLGSPAWKPHATLALVIDVEQGIVVAQRPDAESLAEVAVEVDDGRGPRLAHRALVGWFAGSACRSIFEVSGASSTQMMVTISMTTAYTDTAIEVSKRSSRATEMIGASAPPMMPASW